MASSNPPVKGSSWSTEIGLISVSDTDNFQTSVTLAAGDVLVYQDGVLDGNIDSLPTEIGSSGLLTLTLSADEMNADRVAVKFTDAAGDEWCDALIVIHTVAQTFDTMDTNIDSILTQTGTSGVVLANDAITSAKYDESTAYPIKSADTGSTQIARTGADGDTLETLSDEIAVVDTLLDTTGVVVASHTTAAKAEIEAEAVDALESFDLDHLIQVSAGSEEPTDGSYLDQVMHKNSSQTFDATTDSLEAIRDTLSSASVTVVTAVDGGTVTGVPYATWEWTIDGLADLTDAAENGVLFTVKRSRKDADSEAVLQVQEGVGLLVLDGSSDVTADKASLTVGETEDEITVHVNASQTAFEEEHGLVWDIKKIITTVEDADQVGSGVFVIGEEGVTRTNATS